jgi:formamidopyrimidine-DNA glycosylase
MPELAEVECMMRRWKVDTGATIVGVDLHPRARVFRSCDTEALRRDLVGARLLESLRTGKQMMFRFDRGWLALHLGMTGELRVESPDWVEGRHDHLVLRQAERALVFHDPRMFGAVEFTPGAEPPAWWAARPPEILDPRFTRRTMETFLRRRSRAPIKAVLLMQECFPGVGNWMADEVLWRAGIHPARAAGSLDADESARLYRNLRFVCRNALRTIVQEKNGTWGDPPEGWLFHVRWRAGGVCPATGEPLETATIGGRTTCWSPTRQPFRPDRKADLRQSVQW